MSIIAAGTTTTTALSSTGNTDGTLQLQVNGTTPSVTLNTLGAIGVGSTPGYGSSGQVLTSAGSTAAPTWSTNVSSQWTTTGSDIYYNTGNVGIGTSSPASKLQVTSANGAVTLDSGTGESHYIDITHKGSYSDLGGIRFNQGSTTYGNNQILFRAMDSGGTVQTVMTLNGAGNLGLGVTPSAWATYKALQVDNGAIANYSPTQDASYLSNAYYNAGWKYIASAYALRYAQDGAGGAHKWYTAASGTAGNAISFTQAMTLDASGYLMVGTTSNPISSTAVFSHSGAGYGITVGDITTYTNRTGIYLRGGNENRLAWDTAGYLTFYNGGTERARISSAGGFSVGTTADPGAGAIYATGNITAYYSDDRLKTRLGNIENALDKVDQLQGFYYEANETAQALGYKVKREVGVSAQSVQAVLPEIVSPAPIDQQYLTVDYERLVPLLIEAVKELRAEVKALKGA